MSDPFHPSLSPKQMELLKLCHRYPENLKKYILVSGPRMSTKSTGCMAAIAEHLWEVKDARFAVVCPTVTAGDDSGIWTELTEKTLPEWIGGDFGMEWITTPRQKGTTKKLFCEVKNKYGTLSRVHLDSLKHEDDVEERFKGKSYSGIYVSELSMYKRRETFDCWRECLRGQWQEWQHIFIGDTNPSEEGTDSWIWKLWYEDRILDWGENKGMAMFAECLALMEFIVADNIFKDKAWHLAQKAKYEHSEDLLARYYYGKWVKASGNSVFYEQFRPNVHIVGDPETRSNPDPDCLIPEENCSELISGWDPGEVNHAMVISEKVMIERADKPISIFKFLDEVVHVGDGIMFSDFVAEVLEKIEFWENHLERTIMWRNWSDRNVFDIRGGMSAILPHEFIRQESAGKIIITAVNKGPGSVGQRVDLLKRLFFENRIFISRSKCPHLIESFQGIKKGKGNIAINKLSPLKHAYDSASYLVSSECVDEMIRPREGLNVGKPNESGYTPLPL
jgi:Terminase large subunit, T4likevirus-type, N-terminal